MPRSTRLRTYLAWARQKLCPWKRARKEAIKAIRAGWSIPELAREAGTDRQWLHKWHDRFNEQGKTWQSLDDRSSRPHSCPSMKRHLHEKAILEARQRYPALGVVRLGIVARLPVSHGTIHRVLSEHNQIKKKKRPWRPFKRFSRPFANYLWQMDITQVPTKSEGWVFILSILDDHSRFLLASKCFDKELNTGDVLGVVKKACQSWGKPRQILTDRGCQFTSTQTDGPSLFTLTLDAMGIRHIMGRPHHPRTQGKIERWHRSLKHDWFAYREQQPGLKQVHRILAQWLEFYNFTLPHWGLRLQTPGETYLASVMTPEPIARSVNEVLG